MAAANYNPARCVVAGHPDESFPGNASGMVRLYKNLFILENDLVFHCAEQLRRIFPELFLRIFRSMYRRFAHEHGHAASIAARVRRRVGGIHSLDINVFNRQTQHLGNNGTTYRVRAHAHVSGSGQVVHGTILADPHDASARIMRAELGAAEECCSHKADAIGLIALDLLSLLAPTDCFSYFLEAFLGAGSGDVYIIYCLVNSTRLGVLDDISLPHLHPIDAQLIRDHIHLAFTGKGGMVDAVSPHSCRTAVVGEVTGDIVFEIGKMVRHAHADTGKKVRERAHTGVRATVRNDLVVNTGYYAILGHPGRHRYRHGVTPEVGSETVELGVHYLHRLGRLLGQHHG